MADAFIHVYPNILSRFRLYGQVLPDIRIGFSVRPHNVYPNQTVCAAKDIPREGDQSSTDIFRYFLILFTMNSFSSTVTKNRTTNGWTKIFTIMLEYRSDAVATTSIF